MAVQASSNQNSSLQRNNPLLPSSPPQISDPDHATALVSEAIRQLSMEEREIALGDVHCIAPEVQETPAFVSEQLDALQNELARIVSKSSYTIASNSSPEIVSNQVLRLKFLRSVDFDAVLAAHRLVAFFEIKLELFGLSRVGQQDIKLQDLDEMDIRSIHSGSLQCLQDRDQAERVIVCSWHNSSSDLRTATIHNKLKSLWYVLMAAVEERHVQKRGIVFIYFNAGNKRKPAGDDNEVWQTIRMLRCLPLRILAFHYCHSSSTIYKPLINVVAEACDVRWRARLRTHRGSMSECIATLRTFGVPTKALEEANSQRKKVQMQDWLEARKGLEEEDLLSAFENHTSHQDRATRVVEEPRPEDILFGRGEGFHIHAGNRSFRAQIEAKAGEYEAANRLEKTVLSEQLVREFKEKGRFLRQEEESWVEVPDDVARDKIAHAFRTHRKSLSSSVSSTKMETENDCVQASFERSAVDAGDDGGGKITNRAPIVLSQEMIQVPGGGGANHSGDIGEGNDDAESSTSKSLNLSPSSRQESKRIHRQVSAGNKM